MDSEKGELRLSWNPYIGWDAGIDRYELHETFTSGRCILIDTFDPSVGEYTLDATDEFKYRLRIKAISREEKVSWSNEIEAEFEHMIKEIPNVITPNGDAFNEVFYINKIWLYPKSKLQVVNRWGRKVYEKSNYDNTWSGDNLSSGVYYYLLEVPERNEQFRGSVTILR